MSVIVQHVTAAWRRLDSRESSLTVHFLQFRKPATGMWDRFVNDFNGGVDVDMEASFFVGDAAGRRGDHSDADIRKSMRLLRARDDRVHVD